MATTPPRSEDGANAPAKPTRKAKRTLTPGNFFRTVTNVLASGPVLLAATFMLLVSAGTVVYMPIVVPLMVKGLTVSSWTVAQPMLVLVLIPLVIGVVIQNRSPSTASKIQPFVKKGTGLDTVLMLILIIIIYGKAAVGDEA